MLQDSLSGMLSKVSWHFSCISVSIPGIEAPPVSSTALPLAAVPRILFRFDVEVIDVVHQVLQRVEQQVALQDSEGRRVYPTYCNILGILT